MANLGSRPIFEFREPARATARVGARVKSAKKRRARSFPQMLRIQESWVAWAEKRALLWLAARTPDRIGPDHLTALGFASQIGAGICYALSSRNRYALLGVIACLALNWLGDSLDGTLARVRQQQRPRYGFYVDHMVDSFGALALMGGLALSGYMHPWIAIGLLIAFLMLSIQSYLATHTLGEFRLSFWRFGPTELRILLAVGNLALVLEAVGTSFWRTLPLVRCRRHDRPRRHDNDARRFYVAEHRAALSPGKDSAMTRITAPACENRVRRNNALPSTLLRWCKFNFVGGIGIGVQFAALFLLKGVLHMNYLAATAMAVEAAVLHNFVWHERFTWADRTKLSDGENRAKQRRVARLLRFHLSNGAVSIVGNVALMKVLVGQAHMNYLVAQRDRDRCLLAGKFPGKRNLGLRKQLERLRDSSFVNSQVLAANSAVEIVTRSSAQPSRNSSRPAAA